MVLLQGKSHYIIAQFCPELPMTARRDDNILFPGNSIAHRSGLASRRKLVFPEHRPCPAVESPEMAIHAGCNEHQVTCRRYGPSKINRTPMLGSGEFLRIHHITQ